MDIPTARQKATDIAREIAAGQLDVYEGAMRIWKEVIDKLDESLFVPDDLWPFKSNASAIEDILWNSEQTSVAPDEKLISQCRKEIMQAVENLIQQ